MDISKEELNHISQTYTQQFEGMQKQISFARQMEYDYKKRLRQVVNDDSVDCVVADICRQFLKFYDMGDRLDNDSRLVLDEKRQIDAYIESSKM